KGNFGNLESGVTFEGQHPTIVMADLSGWKSNPLFIIFTGLSLMCDVPPLLLNEKERKCLHDNINNLCNNFDLIQ
ncbi:6368_t:CDS:2, partial [Dentiscutata erythropus]